MQRRGFTLVELLVVILIIGILGGLTYGALQRAAGVSKIVHTKSTIAKLNASLMDRWDSYRNRRLSIDPRSVLATISANGSAYPYVQSQISGMVSRRAIANDNLAQSYSAQNSLQVAAVRLLAMRELMQYEMPCSFGDFADMSGTPGSFQPRAPQVLTQWPIPNPPNIPSLAVTYLRMLNSATTTDKNQILANQSAECLYMILTIGSTDSGLSGEQWSIKDIGDVDGDGLPEFQDAWPVAMNSYQPRGQANSPIDFLRWAPGFVSSVQPDPTLPSLREFSVANHDFFDPLKLDVPGGAIPTPRGFQLTPLIYSAGPNGIWGLEIVGNMSDPYDATGTMAGAPDPNSPPGSADDDITNHDLDTRAGK